MAPGIVSAGMAAPGIISPTNASPINASPTPAPQREFKLTVLETYCFVQQLGCHLF
jgi:hypothetical protein